MLPRPLRRCLATLTVALVLSACRGEPGLPYAEVLKRSADAARALQSAHFTADATIDAGDQPGTFGGTIHADGRLQNGGQQWDFTARARMQANGVEPWDVTADVIVIEENEIYLRVQNAGGDLSAIPLPLAPAMLQKWIRLPSSGKAQPAPDVTPDPKFLSMQAEIVKVTRDRGIVRSGSDKVYHYDIAVDTDKFRTFLREVAEERGEEYSEEETSALFASTELSGQIWIDAESFQMLRVEWTARRLNPDGYQGSFSVQLRDHNTAPPVVPPENAVPLESLLSAPEDIAPFLEAGSMTDEERRQLQDMLQQQ